MDLVDVRCPFMSKNKATGNVYACNRLIVRVATGSSGEGWCRRCKLTFLFEIVDDTCSIKIKTQQVND